VNPDVSVQIQLVGVIIDLNSALRRSVKAQHCFKAVTFLEF